MSWWVYISKLGLREACRYDDPLRASKYRESCGGELWDALEENTQLLSDFPLASDITRVTQYVDELDEREPNRALYGLCPKSGHYVHIADLLGVQPAKIVSEILARYYLDVVTVRIGPEGTYGKNYSKYLGSISPSGRYLQNIEGKYVLVEADGSIVVPEQPVQRDVQINVPTKPFFRGIYDDS